MMTLLAIERIMAMAVVLLLVMLMIDTGVGPGFEEFLLGTCEYLFFGV
jgi:hypothetical protein